MREDALGRAALPLSPHSYIEYRRELWSRRGPNVQTHGDGRLLPCYKHALTKLGVGFATKEEMASAPASTAPSTAPAALLSVRSAANAAPQAQILETMRRAVRAGATEPFYVIDLHAALEKLALWRAMLPDVEPYYAVKCNGDPALLLTLANAGVGFDCASEAEIDQLVSLGVPASRLLYANPIKQPSHVTRAAALGVPLTTFDGAHELQKLARLHPSCGLLLRIAVDDSQAQCVLSNKYGAPPSEAAGLLEEARRLELNVVGVSFHVGSGTSSTNAFRDAVQRAAAVFDLAAAAGRPMTLLDVGGGFPGVDSAETAFAPMAQNLRAALDEYFPRAAHLPRGGVRLIAEPGRFFACATHHLACAIIGKKETPPPSTAPPPDAMMDISEDSATSGATGGAGRTMYYINDGLYGSFNCVLYDHAIVTCEVVPGSVPPSEGATDPATLEATSSDLGTPAVCSVWGPTCDGIDCVLNDARLPPLPIGAWLAFRDMGAYTSCAGSNFNGMALPDVIYLQGRSEPKPQPPDVAAEAMLRELGLSSAPR